MGVGDPFAALNPWGGRNTAAHNEGWWEGNGGHWGQGKVFFPPVADHPEKGGGDLVLTGGVGNWDCNGRGCVSMWRVHDILQGLKVLQKNTMWLYIWVILVRVLEPMHHNKMLAS